MTRKQTYWATGILMVMMLLASGCEAVKTKESMNSKIYLFNGKDLSGWAMVCEDPAVPVGQIWSVRDGVLLCAGQPNSYLRTDKSFSNYRLHVEWRWPAAATNSGVFVHTQTPDVVWPPCIQCQLKAGRAGDIIVMNGQSLTINGTQLQSEAGPGGQQTFENKVESSEKAPGQWNQYGITCDNGDIKCWVNGVLQSEGTAASVTSGFIALQGEAGPIEFRNIYIESIR